MTYSIVARDPSSGELGVAVQSHWFSVGSVVSWAAPGVGAVATQSVAEVSYGPRGLELMEKGHSAEDSLAVLLAEDPRAAYRQVAMIGADGGLAVHTGKCAVAHAGHVTGEDVSCQANMMRSPDVWPAMLDAYADASGPLARRLIAALDAGEAAGGDARGRQSAALLVVPARGEWWRRTVDLRVEDHPEPLAELRRLLTLHEAYGCAGRADELAAEGRHEEAAELYSEAAALVPDNAELRFWAGLGAAQAGDLETGVAGVRASIAEEAGWRELLGHLPESLAPAASAVLARIVETKEQ